jgi:hypothetical protein
MFSPSITNIEGNIKNKANVYFEIGRQWKEFSIGLDLGKTNLNKLDSNNYIEFKPNLNVFKQGKFSNTLTIGTGYIFKAKLNILYEITTGIEYDYSKKIHFNFYLGQYYFSGLYQKNDEIFFGTSIMLYY